MVEVKLMPYCTIDGIPTFRDSEIGYLYTMLEKAGRADDLFCDGSVQSPENFVDLFKNGYNKLWLITTNDKVKGIVCLTDFRQATAQAHFAFFKTEKDTLGIAKEVTKQMIHMKDNDDEYIFSVLIGIVPANNKKALSFTEKMGCTRLCNIPNFIFDYAEQEYFDGVLFNVTRGD